MLAAGAWWVLRYPVFIARIVVQGELVHNNAVTLRANVAPHLVSNFFTVDCAQRARPQQVPWVRRAQVRRVYPGSLRVELQEHDAVAYWGSGHRLGAGQQPGRKSSRRMWAMWAGRGLPRLQEPAGTLGRGAADVRLLEPVFPAAWAGCGRAGS